MSEADSGVLTAAREIEMKLNLDESGAAAIEQLLSGEQEPTREE